MSWPWTPRYLATPCRRQSLLLSSTISQQPRPRCSQAAAPPERYASMRGNPLPILPSIHHPVGRPRKPSTTPSHPTKKTTSSRRARRVRRGIEPVPAPLSWTTTTMRTNTRVHSTMCWMMTMVCTRAGANTAMAILLTFLHRRYGRLRCF